ncbi:MAG: transporter, rane spanning protein [Proteobacteria bacterium]|nr:transporter, rane spanning protein [Pseudomonadota bacterium]
MTVPSLTSEPPRPLVATVLFLTLAVSVTLPVVLLVLWSLSGRWSFPNLLPNELSLDNWWQVLGDDGIGRAALNSLTIAVGAWAMAKVPMRGKRALEMFILAPSIIPGIVVGVSVGQVLLTLGIAYTTFGVILVQTIGTLPLMIRLLTASFETLPDELIHAARSLGAGPLAIFRHLILPLAVPGLMAGGLLSFVGSFEEFDKTFVTGAPVIQTLPTKLYTYLDPYSLQFPLAAIVSLILLLPVLVVFIAAGRIMRDDLMAGGMGKL